MEGGGGADDRGRGGAEDVGRGGADARMSDEPDRMYTTSKRP